MNDFIMLSKDTGVDLKTVAGVQLYPFLLSTVRLTLSGGTVLQETYGTEEQAEAVFRMVLRRLGTCPEQRAGFMAEVLEGCKHYPQGCRILITDAEKREGGSILYTAWSDRAGAYIGINSSRIKEVRQ